MVQVGTWVMSALHHNPGMIASAAETLDEICGGRFVLGLGAGHAGGGAEEFGYRADRGVTLRGSAGDHRASAARRFGVLGFGVAITSPTNQIAGLASVGVARVERFPYKF